MRTSSSIERQRDDIAEDVGTCTLWRNIVCLDLLPQHLAVQRVRDMCGFVEVIRLVQVFWEPGAVSIPASLGATWKFIRFNVKSLFD